MNGASTVNFVNKIFPLVKRPIDRPLGQPLDQVVSLSAWGGTCIMKLTITDCPFTTTGMKTSGVVGAQTAGQLRVKYAYRPYIQVCVLRTYAADSNKLSGSQ